MRFSPAQRRYTRRVMILTLVYVATLLPVILLIGWHIVTGPVAYAIAMVPGLAVSGFFWLMGAYLVEETDEYVRMLITRQILVATGITMTAATVWGFPEFFGLLPHVPSWIWAMVWFLGQGVGGAANYAIERRRT